MQKLYDKYDYIDGANHSLPAIFTQIRHMFLAGPPPFYAPPPRLIHFDFKVNFLPSLARAPSLLYPASSFNEGKVRLLLPTLENVVAG